MRTLALAVILLVAAVTSARPPVDVTILRDRWGVPHIFTSGPGASDRSAYANGYAQAEDRLFEMDILRRAGTGRLAETLGPSYLIMDEVVRRDGYTTAEKLAIEICEAGQSFRAARDPPGDEGAGRQQPDPAAPGDERQRLHPGVVGEPRQRPEHAEQRSGRDDDGEARDGRAIRRGHRTHGRAGGTPPPELVP